MPEDGFSSTDGYARMGMCKYLIFDRFLFEDSTPQIG